MSDFKKVKLTNTNLEGARGIFTKSGHVTLNPGETRDVELSQAELDDLPEHFTLGKEGEKEVAAKEAEVEKTEAKK